MTENYVQKTKYKYDLVNLSSLQYVLTYFQNSNLVISGGNRGGDRTGGPNDQNEPSGEADTLVGKRLATFGDLVQREKPPQTGAVGAKSKQK